MRSASALGVPTGALIKAMPVVIEGDGLVLVLIRGDHRLNEIKLANHLGAAARPARPEEIEARIGPVGFIGPVGADVPILMDEAIGEAGLVTGANRPDAHLIGVEPGRDFAFETLRRPDGRGRGPDAGRRSDRDRDGDRGRQHLQARNALLGPARRDLPRPPTAPSSPIVMGSYGIGPARIVAAAVEQRADEIGICWPPSIAPWQVHVCALGKGGDEVADAAERAVRGPHRGRGRDGARRSARRRHRREADRCGADRLPAADHDRQARSRRGGRGGTDEGRRGGGAHPARRGPGPRRRDPRERLR